LMPSFEQIANDVKETLNKIEAHTDLTAQELADIKASTAGTQAGVDSLRAVTETGFANVSQGIATMIDRQNETNSLLRENNEQNRVIICWLSTLADLSCRQLHRLDTQIELLRSIDSAVTNLRDVLQLVHARETVEVERRDALSRKVDACCPPPTTEPEPCFEPCHEPESTAYQPKLPDFTPLPTPRSEASTQ